MTPIEQAISDVVSRAIEDRLPAQTIRLDPDQLDELAEAIARKNRRFELMRLADSTKLFREDAMCLLGIRSVNTWKKYRKERKIPPAIVTRLGEMWRKGDLLERRGVQ